MTIALIYLYILGGFITSEALYRDRLFSSDDFNPLVEGLIIVLWPALGLILAAAGVKRFAKWRADGRKIRH